MEQIDADKKISELTAGELHNLIISAVYQALLDKSCVDNELKLNVMKPL